MSDRNLRIRVLMEGADRLTRPMRDAAAGSSRLAQTLAATRDRLKDLQKAQGAIGEFRQLKAGLSETERKMAEAQARTTRLGRELAQTANPTKRLRAEFERARRESANLSTQNREQAVRLQELRGRLTAAGVSTRDLVSGERRLRTQIGETNDELREQERRLQQVSDRSRRFADAQSRFSRLQGTATGLAAGGMAAIGTGMAVAAPITVAVEGSMEFESVMTDINQKVNQSREAGRLMGLDLRKAALSVNQFPADLQKGVDTLTGFGLGAREAVDMMTPIGRAATAYKAEIDDLGKATFAAHDNLKVPIEQTGKALDVMAQAGKSGAFEVKDMAQYFPELTASMQSLGSKGVPAVADLAAALQITRKGTGDSASAANNLQNLISKINAGDTIKNFAKFGIDIPAVMKKAAKDGRSPIEEIVRLTQQATGGDQAKLSSLFGDMQVQQALRPLMSSFSEYQAIRRDALAADGTVNTDFADRMQDTAEKVKHAKVQAKDLSLTLGDQLKPAITSVSDTFSSWGERLSVLAERHPTLTRAVVLAAAGFAALFVLLGSGAIVLAGLIAPFAALSGASALLGTTSSAMLLRFGKALLAPLRIFPLFARGGLMLGRTVFPLIGRGAVMMASTFARAGSLLARGAVMLGQTIFPMLARGAIMMAQGVARAGLMLLANPMILAIVALVAAVALAGYLIWKNWDKISGAFKTGLTMLSGIATRFREFGGNLIAGLIGGITGRLSALKSTIINAATSVANWFKEKLGIHSPSRVFAGLGGFVMAGLDQGLAANSGGPLARITELSGQMTRALAVGASGAAIAVSAPAIA